MTITIAPFTVGLSYDYPAPLVEQVKQELTRKNHVPITYWGVYPDDKYISHTSGKELAERTKQWMEKWLKDKL